MADKKVKTNDDAPTESRAVVNFPIVAMGASAGGLEAFEQFFQHAPSDTGMAFVLVPHLDPTHASILTEILQRNVAMRVVEAQDQMAVEADCVHVIPPNREMTIFHGVLQLGVPADPRGHRMPIDVFFRSLAEDQGERAVGIILSGTGSDGTLGLRAILGNGGVSLVQEPTTARYDGMPASAIRAGYATHVLPVEQMLARLTDNHRALLHQKIPTSQGTAAMNRILAQVRTATGHDFFQYKKSTIGRRIERRMVQHGIEEWSVYNRYLQANPAEVQALFRELLINVTSFYRDPAAFVVLKEIILPQLFADKPPGYVFRVWVTGCATGEEVYSIAMVLYEFLEENPQDCRVQIYATDIDEEAIAVARAGVYPANISQDVHGERLHRFFVKEEGGYRIKKEIRGMVIFSIQSVIKDPPFTKVDLVSCRNLLIYLELSLQDYVLSVIHYALRPGGVLFLSPSESIGSHHNLFTPLDRKWKFYQTVHTGAAVFPGVAGGLGWSTDKGDMTPEEVVETVKDTNFSELTKRILLQSYAPASVVTDRKGNILYVHGETGAYLRPAPGHATLNIIEMAREGRLQAGLRFAIQKAAHLGPTFTEQVVSGDCGGPQKVQVVVRPLANPGRGEGLLLVSFQPKVDGGEAAGPAKKNVSRKRAKQVVESEWIKELQQELRDTKENLQATIEEQQSSNEELKSTNEEMQSANEELQSTNEELETSKEELQSMNEELLAVNSELQAKIEQLAEMQNDLKNLFDNINVGAIFLNEQLVIRRFTREAQRVYRLVAADVGRYLGDIKTDLDGESLLGEARVVLDGLVPCERELPAVDGTWYLVRIQPYRTLDNVIEGVVMTFTDISKRVWAESAEREVRELAVAIVDTVSSPLVVLDGALKVVFASRLFYGYFQLVPEETVGCSIFDLGNHGWDVPALRAMLEGHLESAVVEHDFPHIGHRCLLFRPRRIVGRAGGTQMILLSMEEVPIP